MTDEQRYDAAGWVNRQVHTPALDRMAEESVCFSRAYTTNPSCIPARAAIFTGRYPSQCGVPGFVSSLPKKETTFMSIYGMEATIRLSSENSISGALKLSGDTTMRILWMNIFRRR